MNDDLTVFISYRRADSSADAGRLYDALRRRFGRDSLFMDVDSLRPGEDWVDAVEGAVTRCDVLLAIIGPTWAGAVDSEGDLRLHKELDRVRLEIEAALRNGKPVIPVLVEGASMPDAEELPDSLKPLLRRHALRVSHPTFESDLGALVRALKTIDRARHPKPAAKAEPASAPAKSGAKPESGADVTPAIVAPLVAATRAAPVAPPTVTPELGTAPVTLPYIAVQPPVQPTLPVYPVPPFQPAYPYQAPVYGEAQPAGRTRTPPLLVGLLALGFVLVIGFVLLAVLKIGPFAATALASPTPAPTEQPTQVPPTQSPTALPPTDSPAPPTQTATSPPTPSASPTPTASPLTFESLTSWLALGTDRGSCVAVDPGPPDQYWPEDAAVVVNCGPLTVNNSTVRFYRRYALYPSQDALDAAYARYVSIAGASTGAGTCPKEIPSEQSWWYSNPDTSEMGRQLCFQQPTTPYLFFTANHAHLLGILTGVPDETQPTITQLYDAWSKSTGVKRP